MRSRALAAPRASNPVDTSQVLTIALGVAAGVVAAELAVMLFRKLTSGGA